jgi:YidC/Oxa1 family membrane protein insertase
MENSRNFLITIALSVLILTVWQLFYMNPRIEAEREREQARIEAEQRQVQPGDAADLPQPGDPTLPGAPAGQPAVPGAGTALPAAAGREARLLPASAFASTRRACPVRSILSARASTISCSTTIG